MIINWSVCFNSSSILHRSHWNFQNQIKKQWKKLCGAATRRPETPAPDHKTHTHQLKTTRINAQPNLFIILVFPPFFCFCYVHLFIRPWLMQCVAFGIRLFVGLSAKFIGYTLLKQILAFGFFFQWFISRPHPIQLVRSISMSPHVYNSVLTSSNFRCAARKPQLFLPATRWRYIVKLHVCLCAKAAAVSVYFLTPFFIYTHTPCVVLSLFETNKSFHQIDEQWAKSTSRVERNEWMNASKCRLECKETYNEKKAMKNNQDSRRRRKKALSFRSFFPSHSRLTTPSPRAPIGNKK